MSSDRKLLALFVGAILALTVWVAWPLFAKPKERASEGEPREGFGAVVGLAAMLTVGFLFGIIPLTIVLYAARHRPKDTVRRAVAITGLLSGLAFAGLSAAAFLLPQSKGGSFDVRVEVVRYTAVGVGVVFLFFVLGRLLPALLDFLEQRSFTSFVGARHVRATKSGFLTVISILSMAGVGLGSCTLCATTSIMGGFGHDLKRKLLDNNAHVIIDTTKNGGINDWEPTLDRVRFAIAPRKAAATPVVAGDAMGSSVSTTAGVLVRGIDPDTIGDVIALRDNIKAENGGVGNWDYFLHPEMLTELPADTVIGRSADGHEVLKSPEVHYVDPSIAPEVAAVLKNPIPVRPPIILGRELAKSLHVYVGDEISLLSPSGELGPMGVMPRTRKFRVAAIFYSGMYEYDASHAYIDIKVAQEFFNLENKISEIDIRVPEPEKVADFKGAIDGAVSAAMARERPDNAAPLAPLRVRDWVEMNKTLFSALLLEKIASFVILSILIAVATFCIICTLLLMVTEKGKEIAILKALGASNGHIIRIFMLEGVLIGAIGTVGGVMVALASCTGLKWFGVRLDPDVYYIDRLPVNVDLRDYGLVAILAIIICTLMTIYPAFVAADVHPVEGLRHE